MLNLRFRPLHNWPEPTPLGKKRCQFKTKFQGTLDLLEDELHRLRAGNILIEAGFTAADIRNDGWPRGNASATHPGVILYFTTPKGNLRFPCGSYGGWGDNLHAIALTLHALRAIDRYGVTVGHEQYRGFAAIAAPAAGMSVDEAVNLLASWSQIPADRIAIDFQAFRAAYRTAARIAHPDSDKGSPERWRQVNEAEAVLTKLHKEAGRAA